jgi:phosphoglycolate phosphatase-like HAD superfamily hydrolase
VIVGDTPLDHAAAEANGMPCVLVATGRIPLAELERCRPAAVLPDWRDPARARRVFHAL